MSDLKKGYEAIDERIEMISGAADALVPGIKAEIRQFAHAMQEIVDLTRRNLDKKQPSHFTTLESRQREALNHLDFLCRFGPR